MRRLPSFCFSSSLRLRRDISAVTFCENVFAHGGDSFAGDDAASDGRLDGDFKHLARNQFSQAGNEFAAAFIGLIAMADERQRVHRFAADEDVEFDEIGFLISREVIIEGSIAARNAFQTVVKIQDNFVQREIVGEHHASGREIFKVFLHAALILAELQDSADGFLTVIIIALMMGSSILSISLGSGNFVGLSTSTFAGIRCDAIAHLKARW